MNSDRRAAIDQFAARKVVVRQPQNDGFGRAHSIAVKNRERVGKKLRVSVQKWRKAPSRRVQHTIVADAIAQPFGAQYHMDPRVTLTHKLYGAIARCVIVKDYCERGAKLLTENHVRTAFYLRFSVIVRYAN